MIQIFRKRDGKPFLIDESKEGYDTDLYTDIMPPSNLYLPVKFDGGEWVGTPYEEWKKQQIEDDEQPKKEEPDNNKDELIADLSLELLQTQEELKATQEDVANLTLTIMGGSVNA